MTKFLNTSATNYFLEEMFKGASNRIKELLANKYRLQIDVRIVYGPSELQSHNFCIS